jgi:hypothetical protein
VYNIIHNWTHDASLNRTNLRPFPRVIDRSTRQSRTSGSNLTSMERVDGCGAGTGRDGTSPSRPADSDRDGVSIA